MAGLPALKPIERIVDSVHATLRAAILDGGLSPGQPLSVPELSRQLDVSRSPVREALLALVADGLAVELPRRGVSVVEVAASDLLEIHEVREAVEAQAARLCAERASGTTLRGLADVLTRQHVVVEQEDAAGWFRTNAEFHGAIAAGTGNRRLAEVLLNLEAQMRLGLRQVSSDREQRRRGLAEHQAVLDAISRHDPDTAERTMRDHIRPHEAGARPTPRLIADPAIRFGPGKRRACGGIWKVGDAWTLRAANRALIGAKTGALRLGSLPCWHKLFAAEGPPCRNEDVAP